MESANAAAPKQPPKYEVVKEIGKGSFGKVSQVRRTADGKLLVWKEINYGTMSEREKQLLVSEVNILRELRHPNITRYYDRVINKDHAKLYIVMEYCSGGDLANMIRTRKKQLRDSKNQDMSAFVPEETAWKILSQLTLALLECHMRKEGNKILHRDLKPGNVFFDADQNVKLGDFGLSRIMGDESVFAYTHVGTPYYMSPEQIQEQRYNEKSDIWSAGCVIYEMLALRAPFEATNQIQLAYKIKLGKIDRIPAHYSDEIFQVISSMIALEPARRPSVKNLMKHPRISFVIRQLEVKRKETDVLRKTNDVACLESKYQERCELYDKKMAQIQEKEARLKLMEEQLLRRDQNRNHTGLPPTSVNNRSPKFSSQAAVVPQPPQKNQARMDSTDRAISRILDQQINIPQSNNNAVAPTNVEQEESKKENDQKMMNINFRLDHRRNSSSGRNNSQYDSQTSAANNSMMPNSIHNQQLASYGNSEQNSVRPDEIQDTQSSVGNFSGLVVQTPQASVIPKEMPNNSAQMPVNETMAEEGKSQYSTNKPPSSNIQGGLLSGIEQQRQKLQELKRGLNQASSQSSRGLSSQQQQSNYLQGSSKTSAFLQSPQEDPSRLVTEESQSASRMQTQESTGAGQNSQSNSRYSKLDSQNNNKRESPMGRHGRYGSTTDVKANCNRPSTAHQSKPTGAPQINSRQRSNSAQKLGSNNDNIKQTYATQNSRTSQQPPSNSYINRLRSQSKERIQQAQAMMDRQNSQTRITGSNVATPVVSSQKKPLPVSVHQVTPHSASGSQFQTPKQALAGMIRKNTPTGRGSGSRNRYEAQTNAQNPTTYLSSNRSQTAIPQHPGQPPTGNYSRINSAHKYQQASSSAQQQFGSRRASGANATQQVVPRSHTSNLTGHHPPHQTRYASPGQKHTQQPPTTQAARAAQNYALAQQRRTSNSRLSAQGTSTDRQHNFGSNSNLAMAGRGGRVASRNNSRGDSIGNRAGSSSRLSATNQPGMIRQNQGSRGLTTQGSNGNMAANTRAAAGQRDLRNALEEITQRIQSKYLQV